MIFYFSGTGNSMYAATKLGEKLQEAVMDIAVICQENESGFNYTPLPGEKLGFVFPVYAWQPPAIVKSFIKNLNLQGVEKPYIFAVCTMGGSAGNTMDILKKWFGKKNLILDSGYSLLMPDNYIVAFEVEGRDEEAKKLAHADLMLQKIAKAVQRGRKNFFPIKKGGLPNIKSGIVNPLFQSYYTNTKRFYATGECIGCGQCQKICTSQCIHMEEEHPVWDKGKCNMCLACLNRCPKHAIQYGKKTEGRGRYIHPSLK